MKRLAILSILMGSILILISNGYAFVSKGPVEKYSLSPGLFSRVTADLDDRGRLSAYGEMIPLPLLAKLNHSVGSLPAYYRNFTDSPGQHTEIHDPFNIRNSVRQHLKFRLEALNQGDKMVFKSYLIYNPELLVDFYEHRKLAPVWVTEDGLNAKAEVLMATLRRADQEGLDSKTYHQDDIFTLLTDIEHSSAMEMFEPAKYAELELLLTDAFFSYGFNLSEGIVEPNSSNIDWHINKPQKDIPGILKTTLNDDRLEGLVDTLQPRHSGYLRLKAALLKYQNIKKTGLWNQVPAGPKMRRGDAGKRVVALRLRLIASNDIQGPENANQDYFDQALENGIKKFQARHGLKVDGIVGFNTLSALNVPLEDRIEQIKLNMERWRWLPQDLGERYLLVNTADFQLKVIENEQTVKTIRTIVGRKNRPTPALSRRITYLELNPYWNIPHKIAINDILPCIKKDPDYLTKKGIRVFENWTADAKELDPESIDWSGIGKKNFIYKLRQDPKSSNALGRVKFMFPNKFSIYLHDTPSRDLFQRKKRAFSSGCVRVEKPMELAAYLLSENPEWNLQELIAAVDSKKNRAISLLDPVNIHILYWTAWVDNNGSTHFREDIYGRDRRLKAALDVKGTSSEMMYGKKSEKGYLSFLSPPDTFPPIPPVNTYGAQGINNAALH